LKLLLVEDEIRLAEALAHFLKKNGFVVDIAQDGETGIDMACTGVYDIIILDRMLPCQDGLSLLKEFRSLGYDTPVIFLSAKDSPDDRVEGLNAGADDYLVKPFYTVELLARLKALSRRREKDLAEDVLSADGFVLDPQSAQVVKSNEVIQLTAKESQLLELLIRNYGRVVTKERILQKVWGFNSEIEPNAVNLYIFYLRKKLNITSLKTVRGIGYCLQANNTVALKAN